VTVDPSFRSVTTTTPTDTGDDLAGGAGDDAEEPDPEGETGDDATVRGDEAVGARDVTATEDAAGADGVDVPALADVVGPPARAWLVAQPPSTTATIIQLART
jgi:hypothetical protein